MQYYRAENREIYRTHCNIDYSLLKERELKKSYYCNLIDKVFKDKLKVLWKQRRGTINKSEGGNHVNERLKEEMKSDLAE
jgi:hypothetical protein